MKSRHMWATDSLMDAPRAVVRVRVSVSRWSSPRSSQPPSHLLVVHCHTSPIYWWYVRITQYTRVRVGARRRRETTRRDAAAAPRRGERQRQRERPERPRARPRGPGRAPAPAQCPRETPKFANTHVIMSPHTEGDTTHVQYGKGPYIHVRVSVRLRASPPALRSSPVSLLSSVSSLVSSRCFEFSLPSF